MIPAVQAGSDEHARLRIRESLDESLIVEASAGTGKTTELVNRIVAVLKRGAKIQNIAAVTFTQKAAGELKLKLREELDQSRHGEPAVEQALQYLEEASIGTIHAFCAQILRERPVEAGVDPAFEELNEQEGSRMYEAAFRAWLEARLNTDSPALRRAFARLTWRDSWDDTPPIERLQTAGRAILEWREYNAAWRREPFAREEEIRTLTRMAEALAERSREPRNVNDYLFRHLAPVRTFADTIRQTGAEDYDSLEARLLKLGRELRELKSGKGYYGPHASREDLLAKRGELVQWIRDFQVRADAELAALLRSELDGLLDEYDARKRKHGKLDFFDLLKRTRDLIRDRAEVRQYLQKRFTHLFVDEFQDTEPLQLEILLLLAADDPAECDWRSARPAAGKLFLVGDPKQSIYKFRRADILTYTDVSQRLQQQGVGHVTLTRSFRAVANIQALVNAAFEPEMNGDAASGQASWAPLHPVRADDSARPSVIVLPVPRPYGISRLSKEVVAGGMADAIAAYIAWLINDSGWGISAKDIAVLFRKRNFRKMDLTRELARALEARGVAHLLAGSKSFYRREEIETLRSALTAVEWPDDELHVFATLKGSLFAIADEILLRYRHAHGKLHPFRKPENCDAAFAPVTEALGVLADLHRQRNRQPFSSTVNALLEAARAHAGFVLRPGGNQILANVMRLCDVARNFEMSGGLSFRGFVEDLAAQAEKEQAAEAPVLEEDSDGVRLMTVHSAKGLEFRVVILADLVTGIAREEGEVHFDGARNLCAIRLLGCAPWELLENNQRESTRQYAEGVRVAYVAATRAQDLLVVPAVGDGAFPQDSWLAPLNKALYPSRAGWRKSSRDARCPEFGQATVLARPSAYDREDEFSVHPGLVQPEHGTHEVVWWDPWKLTLDVEGGFGPGLAEQLADDGGTSLAEYRAWQAERTGVLAQGSTPRLDVFLASQAQAPPVGAIAVEVSSAAKTGGRPGGRRFGTLVHSVLRDIALDATGDAIERMVRLNARAIGATEQESVAAWTAVAAALAHPLITTARRAERCYREYPVTLRLDGDRVVEGVIDLAFIEDGHWTIVDFKTDADTAEVRAQYQRQLQWYAFAMTEMTGMPARAVLLGV